MEFKNLPEIEFCNANAEMVKNIVFGKYQEITGRSLAKGDPVRLFLLSISSSIVLLLNKINETGKQNLLAFAGGNNLDHIGILIGVDRIPAVAATITIQIKLSQKLATSLIISAGTRFTAGDNIFFSLDNNVTIAAGTISATAAARCTALGSIGNGYPVGSINTLVDPVPYVESVSNTTISEGGADVESDEDYRERIRLAPEKFSCAGPDGAYIYYAKSASALITDVTVTSPTPGKVQIVPLLTGGEIPGEEILADVLAVCSDRTVRPLTDQVTAVAPTKVEYNIAATYYIDRTDEVRAVAIQAQIAKAVQQFILWEKSKLGRDINPSELIRRIMDAGAKRVNVAEPVFTVVNSTQVAVAHTTTVTLGGLENE